MSPEKIKLMISVAGAPGEKSLQDVHVLDCQQSTTPNDLLATLYPGQSLSGWPTLTSLLSSSHRPDWSLQLRNLELLLLDDAPNCGKRDIEECLFNSRSNDHWSAAMSLRSYLEIQKIPDAKKWLEEHADLQRFSISDGINTDIEATPWQRSWSGAHPQMIDFVRRHRMELPKTEPTMDFQQLSSSTVINALSDRETSTIFDKIWGELPRGVQWCVSDIVANPTKPVPGEIQELESFGFWKTPNSQGPLQWFSPLFAGYVYFTKTRAGILKRIFRWGEFTDGVTELLGWLSRFRYRLDKMIFRVLIAAVILALLVWGKPYTLHWLWFLLFSTSMLFVAGVLLAPFAKNMKLVLKRHKIASAGLLLPIGILSILIFQAILYFSQGGTVNTDWELPNKAATVLQIVSPLSLAVWLFPRLNSVFNRVFGAPSEEDVK